MPTGRSGTERARPALRPGGGRAARSCRRSGRPRVLLLRARRRRTPDAVHRRQPLGQRRCQRGCRAHPGRRRAPRRGGPDRLPRQGGGVPVMSIASTIVAPGRISGRHQVVADGGERIGLGLGPADEDDIDRSQRSASRLQRGRQRAVLTRRRHRRGGRVPRGCDALTWSVVRHCARFARRSRSASAVAAHLRPWSCGRRPRHRLSGEHRQQGVDPGVERSATSATSSATGSSKTENSP